MGRPSVPGVPESADGRATPSQVPVARQTYDDAALEYVRHADVSVYNHHYERPAMRRLLTDLAGKRVLDAGCAGGAQSEWLVGRGATVVALDVSDRMVELSRVRIGEGAVVLQADLSLPLPQVPELADGSFDVVMSSLTLHYVDDWSRPLAEFFRLLKPGGTLVFSTHHPYWDRRLVAEDDYFQTGLVEDYWSLSGGIPVGFRFYRKTLAQIVTSVAEAGLVIDSVEEPLPSEDLRTVNLIAYDELRKQPAFLIIQSHRP